MISMLASVIGQRGVDAMAFLLAFALTALTDSIFRDKLPHDHGRAFAVNGELSQRTPRIPAKNGIEAIKPVCFRLNPSDVSR